MNKDTAITVRIPLSLKQRIHARARRERRSLSAQVVCDLERATRHEPPEHPGRGKLLGRFPNGPLPSDADFTAARARMWERLTLDG